MHCLSIIICSTVAVCLLPLVAAYSQGDAFSLSAYQRARALETFNQLDASRFHFQILFVDNDNFRARIASAIFARVAEYNDALFTLFPCSATYPSSQAPADPTAPSETMDIGNQLGLCSVRCAEEGIKFDTHMLDEYDLVLCVDDEIHQKILRSLPKEGYGGYEEKCRLLSEFLSCDFYNINAKNVKNDEIIAGEGNDNSVIVDTLETELWERAEPFYDFVKDASSNIFSTSHTSKDVLEPRMILNENGAAVPNTKGWPIVEAAMMVACAGLTRFCLDTMDVQFDTAFENLLHTFFYKTEHLDLGLKEADAQLRKGSFSITGYFSPKQRLERIERHMAGLKKKTESYRVVYNIWVHQKRLCL